MYITCYNLFMLNLYRGACCGSCHADAEDWPDTYPLLEVRGEHIGLEDKDKVIGEVCCTLSRDLIDNSEGRGLLRKCYEEEV